MTEQTNADLISVAEEFIGTGEPYEDLIVSLAERLEAADQRAAELAAVIEQTEDFVTRHYLDTRFGDEVLPILATAPADALREHDAALIEGLADQIRHKQHAESIRQWLREKARQRREEQDR